jgi:hypothetical protein
MLHTSSMFTDQIIISETFEWEDGNPDAEKRWGQTVCLHNGFLVFASDHPDLEIVGVVAPGDENTIIAANTHPHEWHAKHVKGTHGEPYFEDQTLVTWITHDQGRVTHEADRMPPNTMIPPEAEYWTHWPETGQKLRRPILTDRYLDGTQGRGPYLGRQDRNEWACIVLLGKAVVNEGQLVNKSWVHIKNNVWLIR